MVTRKKLFIYYFFNPPPNVTWLRNKLSLDLNQGIVIFLHIFSKYMYPMCIQCKPSSGTSSLWTRIKGNQSVIIFLPRQPSPQLYVAQEQALWTRIKGNQTIFILF